MSQTEVKKEPQSGENKEPNNDPTDGSIIQPVDSPVNVAFNNVVDIGNDDAQSVDSLNDTPLTPNGTSRFNPTHDQTFINSTDNNKISDKGYGDLQGSRLDAEHTTLGEKVDSSSDTAVPVEIIEPTFDNIIEQFREGLGLTEKKSEGEEGSGIKSPELGNVVSENKSEDGGDKGDSKGNLQSNENENEFAADDIKADQSTLNSDQSDNPKYFDKGQNTKSGKKEDSSMKKLTQLEESALVVNGVAEKGESNDTAEEHLDKKSISVSNSDKEHQDHDTHVGTNDDGNHMKVNHGSKIISDDIKTSQKPILKENTKTIEPYDISKMGQISDIDDSLQLKVVHQLSTDADVNCDLEKGKVSPLPKAQNSGQESSKQTVSDSDIKSVMNKAGKEAQLVPTGIENGLSKKMENNMSSVDRTEQGILSRIEMLESRRRSYCPKQPENPQGIEEKLLTRTTELHGDGHTRENRETNNSFRNEQRSKDANFDILVVHQDDPIDRTSEIKEEYKVAIDNGQEPTEGKEPLSRDGQDLKETGNGAIDAQNEEVTHVEFLGYHATENEAAKEQDISYRNSKEDNEQEQTRNENYVQLDEPAADVKTDSGGIKITSLSGNNGDKIEKVLELDDLNSNTEEQKTNNQNAIVENKSREGEDPSLPVSEDMDGSQSPEAERIIDTLANDNQETQITHVRGNEIKIQSDIKPDDNIAAHGLTESELGYIKQEIQTGDDNLPPKNDHNKIRNDDLEKQQENHAQVAGDQSNIPGENLVLESQTVVTGNQSNMPHLTQAMKGNQSKKNIKNEPGKDDLHRKGENQLSTNDQENKSCEHIKQETAYGSHQELNNEHKTIYLDSEFQKEANEVGRTTDTPADVNHETTITHVRDNENQISDDVNHGDKVAAPGQTETEEVQNITQCIKPEDTSSPDEKYTFFDGDAKIQGVIQPPLPAGPTDMLESKTRYDSKQDSEHNKQTIEPKTPSIKGDSETANLTDIQADDDRPPKKDKTKKIDLESQVENQKVVPGNLTNITHENLMHSEKDIHSKQNGENESGKDDLDEKDENQPFTHYQDKKPSENINLETEQGGNQSPNEENDTDVNSESVPQNETHTPASDGQLNALNEIVRQTDDQLSPEDEVDFSESEVENGTYASKDVTQKLSKSTTREQEKKDEPSPDNIKVVVNKEFDHQNESHAIKNDYEVMPGDKAKIANEYLKNKTEMNAPAFNDSVDMPIENHQNDSQKIEASRNEARSVMPEDRIGTGTLTLNEMGKGINNKNATSADDNLQTIINDDEQPEQTSSMEKRRVSDGEEKQFYRVTDGPNEPHQETISVKETPNHPRLPMRAKTPDTNAFSNEQPLSSPGLDLADGPSSKDHNEHIVQEAGADEHEVDSNNTAEAWEKEVQKSTPEDRAAEGDVKKSQKPLNAKEQNDPTKEHVEDKQGEETDNGDHGGEPALKISSIPSVIASFKEQSIQSQTTSANKESNVNSFLTDDKKEESGSQLGSGREIFITDTVEKRENKNTDGKKYTVLLGETMDGAKRMNQLLEADTGESNIEEILEGSDAEATGFSNAPHGKQERTESNQSLSDTNQQASFHMDHLSSSGNGHNLKTQPLREAASSNRQSQPTPNPNSKTKTKEKAPKYVKPTPPIEKRIKQSPYAAKYVRPKTPAHNKKTAQHTNTLKRGSKQNGKISSSSKSTQARKLGDKDPYQRWASKRGASEKVTLKPRQSHKEPTRGRQGNGSRGPSEARSASARFEGVNSAPPHHTKSLSRQGGGKKENSEATKVHPAKRNTGGSTDRDGRKQQKEYFKEELKRLRTSLQKEAEKIKPPEQKQYSPYTFNSLKPYYDTHTAEYIINLDDEVRHGFISRQTAVGLCDPWVDHRMDIELLPKINSNPTRNDDGKKQKKKRSGERPPKEGSTRLPKFPSIKVPTGDLTTKTLYYSDVPMLRDELRKKYSDSAVEKVNEEYQRTKADFYRMELDRIKEYHPLSRPNMRKAYFAYLQNNPGSKKAVYECVKTAEKDAENDEQEQAQDSSSVRSSRAGGSVQSTPRQEAPVAS